MNNDEREALSEGSANSCPVADVDVAGGSDGFGATRDGFPLIDELGAPVRAARHQAPSSPGDSCEISDTGITP